MSELDEIFKGMAEAKGSNSGTFFTTGVFTVALKDVEWIPDGYKGTSCKFHLTVVKSSNETDHPIGATRVWILKFDKKEQRERTLADIKAFFFALGGADPRSLKNPESNPQAHHQATMTFKAFCDPTFAAANGMADKVKTLLGRQCIAEVEVVDTKPRDGKPAGKFTRHAFFPVPKAVPA